MGKVGHVMPLPGRFTNVSSRLWFLTTILGMWTIYTRTIPSLRRRAAELRSELDLEADGGVGAMRKERKDVRWSAYKLWSDLVFVCKPSLYTSSQSRTRHPSKEKKQADTQRTTYLT